MRTITEKEKNHCLILKKTRGANAYKRQFENLSENEIISDTCQHKYRVIMYNFGRVLECEKCELIAI